MFGLGAFNKVKKLVSGMTEDDVRKLLKKEPEIQMIQGKKILKYNLLDFGVGFRPVYLTFDAESKLLVEWYVNEEEFRHKQKMWLEAYKQMNRQSDNE